MNVKYKAHTDTPVIVMPFVRVRHKCNGCGKLVKPLFQLTSNLKDWLWLDCHICRCLLCEDCCSVTAEGITECLLCYQARLVLKGLRKGMRAEIRNRGSRIQRDQDPANSRALVRCAKRGPRRKAA